MTEDMYPTKKRAGKRVRIAVGCACAVLAVALVFSPALRLNVFAFFDETDAVHVDAGAIENGTLAIGTHLIHLSALTTELYDKAQATVADSGQERIYYKSELAGGAWCDITDAQSLAVIATGYQDPSGQTPPATVDNAVVSALYFQYHTKSDGITYDLRDGQAICPFDVPDPYDLENMEELSPLKMHYDNLKEGQAGTDAGKQQIKKIEQFWQTNVRSVLTDDADNILGALQRYYVEVAKRENAEPELSAIQGVMAAVDASRRYEVLVAVDEALAAFLDVASSDDNGAYTEVTVIDGDDTDIEHATGALTDANLTSALGESISNVQTSMTDKEGRRLSEGVTVLSAVRYEASYGLIANAQSGDYAAADGDVVRLICLANIEAGEVQRADEEMKLLEDSLIPRASNRLTALLQEGENTAYKDAVASGQAGAVLASIEKERLAALNAARGELESFLTALADRKPAEETQPYIDNRITITEGWGALVPDDAFKGDAGQCVENHLDYLRDLKKGIENALGGNDLDQLAVEKASLQTDYKSALDGGDLAGAKATLEQIEALDARIAEAAEGTADGAPGSVDSLAADLLKEALDTVNNGGNASALGDTIDALSGIAETNPLAGQPALQKLLSAMQDKDAKNGTSTYKDQIEKAISHIADNQAAYDLAKSGAKDQAALAKIAEDFLASGADALSGLSASEKAAAELNALADLAAATGSDAAKQQLAAKAQGQMNGGNPLVFKALYATGEEYLPVTAISYAGGMRYVYNRNLSQATLARGADYYIFTSYSDEVRRAKDAGKVDTMEYQAGFQGCIHVPESYTEAQFGFHAVYLGGTDLGVLISEKTQAASDALLEALMA
ncbi:MAG: hypothetical protein LBR44_10760 [Clostridiales Family XIII bacterium]|nr:hypothetical protein [Clostridiales Family XIII bacterium]